MAGDDARIERWVKQVGRRQPKNRRRSLSWQVFPALVAGLLLGGVAVAAVGFTTPLFQSRAGPAAPAKPADSPVVARGPSGAARNDAIVSTQPEPPQNSVPPLDPRVDRSRAATPTSEAPSESPLTIGEQPAVARFNDPPGASFDAPGANATAAELFTAGNRLRVQGNIRAASEIYERLRSEFPKSTEAATARLSLGMLYLRQGFAERSLEEFRAYRQGGRGATMAEALWGEAQALRALGRAADEQRVLRELLEQYPQSAYASPAQKRLGERD